LRLGGELPRRAVLHEVHLGAVGTPSERDDLVGD
jgi:hypothetical protein